VSFKAAKSLPARGKSAGTPSDGQLAQIRQYCLNDMAAESLYTRSFVLAHNCIDRDAEAFDEGLLADFAKSLPGKGIYIKHPNGWDGDTGPAEGKWYGAQLQTCSLDEARAMLKEPDLNLPPDRSTVTLLMADGYFAKTADNATLLTKMDAGIAGDVSIGFKATARTPIKDAQGRELQACRIVGPGEALEGSLVWLGAQPGARAIKGAKANKRTTSQDDDEESNVDQKEFDTQIAAEQAKTKALQPQADKFTALKTALGKDNEVLADDPTALAALAIAGKAARASMIDDLVAADRQKGAVGDKPEEVEAAKAAYASFPIAQLKTLHGIASKTTQKPAAIRGSDPNASPEVAGDKAFADDHPLKGLLQFAPASAAA